VINYCSVVINVLAVCCGCEMRKPQNKWYVDEQGEGCSRQQALRRATFRRTSLASDPWLHDSDLLSSMAKYPWPDYFGEVADQEEEDGQ